MSVSFRSYTPALPLGQFVQNFWLSENCGPIHSKERILPSGTIELVINLHDDELRIYEAARPTYCTRFPGALVSGAYGGFFVIDTAEERSVMGVHFKPGGAFPFLGVSSEAMADRHIGLETLWGRAAVELRERLCEAITPAERFRILENELSAHLFRPLEKHYAVSAALNAFERPVKHLMVREMAKIVGLSQRRFIRVFSDEVGLTPKRFCRIQRFQRAAMLAHRSNLSPDWAQIATTCGYFDQAHFINDFLEFSGFTPADYARQIHYQDCRGIHRRRNHFPLTQ
jgi:AraC-like DNA-binding protein